MKIIGLTVGIGSGKTTVAKVFQSLGIPIFFADEVGRNVLDSDHEVMGKVTQLLGAEAYSGQKANRKWIASRVFQDNDLLNQLNAIVHPAVKKAFILWQKNLPKATAYCIREAAILFESGAAEDCDAVVCVCADSVTRMNRVIQRDRVDRKEVEARMARQMPEAEKRANSDYLIDNDGDKSIIQQVLLTHEKIKNS